MSRSEYKRGKYTPENIKKYVGKKIPIYRSSYELRLCHFFDSATAVIEWASEPVAIQYMYINDVGDEKWGLYIPDYYAKMSTQNGEKKYLIEAKPYKQTIPPVPPKINNKKALDRYRSEQALFAKNKSKWFYASKFCEKHGFEFKILTEKDIF